MAVNHISPDKVVGSFFNRASRNADISGNVPSDHLVKEDGRMGRRMADKVKIQDDIQFKGRAFRGNGSTIQAESVSITPGSVSEVRMKVVFKLNDLSNQTICSWNGNSTQYVILNLDGSGFFEVTRRNSATQYDTLTTTTGVLGHWYEVDLTITSTSFTISIDGVVEAQTALPVAAPSPNGSFVLCGFRTATGANSTASIASFKGWLDGTEKCDYLIEESSGNVLYDYSPGANHANIINTVDNTHFHEDSGIPYSHLNEKGYNIAGPSYFKNAYVADDHAQRTPAWASFMADADFSVAFTINVSTRQDGNVYDIMSNSGGISSGVYILITGGKIQITVTKSISNTRTITSRDLRDGLDHDVLVVYEASSLQCRIYVDGLEESYGAQVTGVGVNQYNPNTSWVIGKYKASAADRNFTGYIKAVSFYNSELTPATLKTGNPVAQPQVASDGTVTDLVGGSTWTSNNLDNTDPVPADSTGLYDTQGHRLLDYPGRLAPRLQLANAPCVVLNGTDQSISLPYETQVAGDQDTTFWFKVKIDPGSGDYTVFGSGDLSLFRWSTSDTTIRLRGHTNGAESIMTFSHSIRTGEWQDVVLIRRFSDSKFTCYINGVQNTEGYISVSSGNSFRIDSLGEGSTRWTDGEISLFGKWFRSFSLTEIQALSTQLPSTDGVEDLYVFSEGSGSTVYDVSGNNKHATIVNAILPDVWGKQNVFHYNFYKGFIKSLKDMDGVEAFFDFTDINSYTFDANGQISSVRDAADNYELINTHADTRFENGALTLAGNRLSIEGDHFLSTLNSFDIFIRGEFKLPYSSQTDFLVVSNNTNAETWTIGKHPISTIPNVYYDAASATPAYSGNIEVTQIILDQEIGYNIKYDGSNLHTGRDTNSLTDHGPTSKPADNPLLTRIDFGIDGSQKYLIVFNRNVTDQERLFVNAFMESGLAPAGAVNGVIDQKGYEETNQYNGSSDIRFPDIPEIPSNFRGNTYSPKELIEENIYHKEKRSFILSRDFLSRSEVLGGVGLHPKMKELINQGLTDGQSIVAANSLLYSIEEDFSLENDFYAIYPMVGETGAQLRVNVLDPAKSLVEGGVQPVYSKDGIYLPYTTDGTFSGIRLIAPYFFSEVTSPSVCCQMAYQTLDSSSPNFATNDWTYWGFTNQPPDWFRVSRFNGTKYFLRLQSTLPGFTSYIDNEENFLAISRQNGDDTWKFMYDDTVQTLTAAFSTTVGDQIRLRIGGANYGGTEGNVYVGTFKFFAIGKRNFTQAELELMREKVRKFQSNMGRV